LPLFRIFFLQEILPIKKCNNIIPKKITYEEEVHLALKKIIEEYCSFNNEIKSLSSLKITTVFQ